MVAGVSSGGDSKSSSSTSRNGAPRDHVHMWRQALRNACKSARHDNGSSACEWAWQHAQSAPLAAPQLGSCTSSGCAWRLWAARHSQEEAGPLRRPAAVGSSSDPPSRSPTSLPLTTLLGVGLHERQRRRGRPAALRGLRLLLAAPGRYAAASRHHRRPLGGLRARPLPPSPSRAVAAPLARCDTMLLYYPTLLSYYHAIMLTCYLTIAD